MNKRNWALQMFVQQCWADFLWRGCLSPCHYAPDKRWVCSPQGTVLERQLKCHKNTSALIAAHIFQVRRNKQTIFSSLHIPANSSYQLTSQNRGHREIRKFLSAPGLRLLLHLAGLMPAQQAGFFLEIIWTADNSHKCNGLPINFQFIASTAPLPASGNDLSALLLKITSLKCNSSTFHYFRILQENWRTFLCLLQFKCQHNFQTREVDLELLEEKKIKIWGHSSFK